MGLKMRGGCLVLACLMVTCQAASADAVRDCNQSRRPDIQIIACTKIIESRKFGPNEKTLAYMSRGKARTDAGALRSAMADFTAAIRLKKTNGFAFAGRGRAKSIWGNLSGAIDDYSEAIRISPNSDDLYIERGHVYTVMKNFDAAIGDLTMAIRLNPRTSRAFDERGLAYFKKGDLDRSLKDYTAAITIFEAPEYYASRGHIYEIKGDKLKAIDDLRHALLADPSLVVVRDALKRLGAEQPIAIETERRIRDGMALAEAKCANCHAIGATGVSPNKDAPEFRNIYRRHAMFALRLPITQGVTAIHDQMPQFKLSVGEIDAIAAYINSLSKAGDD
jgi:tetratricopeptide (TPR) repeat protein